MYKKTIIVFEGIEGSGKSFHINNVANYLKKKRVKFVKLRLKGITIINIVVKKPVRRKNTWIT